MAILKVSKSGWHRHFFYRKESVKTTWKFKLCVLVLVVAALLLTHRVWSQSIAESLICPEKSPHVDALLLENFDANYLVFERAELLLRQGVASRVLVPAANADEGDPNSVSRGVAELMARIARLPKIEVIPIAQVEPISLNAANQIRDALLKEGVKSVIVVTPAFRSRRSALVYGAVLTPAGIDVSCVPVYGLNKTTNWTTTWHGIQEVAEHFLKLQYYRFYVLL
jgi:hypothetical protein